MAGTRITLFAFVLTRSCAPVAGAKVDIWQADSSGSYDNTGYTLRGHVFTDAQGRFQMQTIVPGRYPGRTPHIHVKITATGGPELTTQLYMPNEASNATDAIFRPELTVTMNAPSLAYFMFVLDKA
jgi:protocatechuate 3,4-dioxygenase beta subunit